MSASHIFRKPPNGMWKGYYNDERRGIGSKIGKNEFQVGISFSDDGFVIGSGLDREFYHWNGNGFDIIGQWKPSNSTITFTKSYRNQHGIYYSGVVSYDGNQTTIKGHWKLSWHGNFDNEFSLVHNGQHEAEIFDYRWFKQRSDTPEPCAELSFLKNLKQFHHEVDQGNIHGFYDFKIVSESDQKSTNCNKTLLAMQSKYFLTKFKEEPRIDHEIVTFSHDCVQICVDMLYTGESNLTESNVEDALELSEKLQLIVIKERAIDFILDGLCLSNCIKTLILGEKFKNKEMTTRSIQFIAKNFEYIEAKYNEELYQLHFHLLQKVLASNYLILRSKDTGVIHTGLVREFSIISYLDKYIRLHPEFNVNENSIHCVRLPESLLDALSKTMSTTALGSKLEENGLLSSSRITTDKKDVKKSEVTLVSSLETLDDENSAKLLQRITNIIDKTSEKCLAWLKVKNCDQSYAKGTKKSIEKKQSMLERKLSKSTTFSTFPIGNEANYGENVQNRVSMFGMIRKIRIHSTSLRSRHVERWQANDHPIILKGLELYCEETVHPYRIGLDDGEGTFIDNFELEEGEHICMVKGRSAEFILQLCFVTNRGRMLKMGGNPCSRSGEEFSTLNYIRRNTSQDEMIPLQHMYLKGMCTNIVKTREGFSAMAQVQFCMEIITNNSVKFRAPNNELLELENEVRDLSRAIQAERQRVLDY